MVAQQHSAPRTDGARRPRTVVVTGASGGVGRAVARRFAASGDRVALLARGDAGLAAAAEDVEKLGGTPFVVEVDVADHEAVDAAADTVEERLGPIDVWINAAFSTIFAPVGDITAEEFRRATEVTYLGVVYGTMAALKRMNVRGRGSIVQVGSALAQRSIPLQSAYCGAKHGVDGFTESLRTELLHDRSAIHVTVVQLPAVNTPQFSWVRSRLARHPRPVAPIYQPEVAARAVHYAADHPARKQYWLGISTVLTLLGQRTCPAVLDRYLARTGYDSQQTDQHVHEHNGNLTGPLDAETGHDYGAHGVFDAESHARSELWWLRTVVGRLTTISGSVAGMWRGIRREFWREMRGVEY